MNDCGTYPETEKKDLVVGDISTDRRVYLTSATFTRINKKKKGKETRGGMKYLFYAFLSRIEGFST